jgi:hypothetical protein
LQIVLHMLADRAPDLVTPLLHVLLLWAVLNRSDISIRYLMPCACRQDGLTRRYVRSHHIFSAAVLEQLLQLFMDTQACRGWCARALFACAMCPPVLVVAYVHVMFHFVLPIVSPPKQPFLPRAVLEGSNTVDRYLFPCVC